MDRWKTWLRKLLFPPAWVVCLLPPASFAVLTYVFITHQNHSPLGYAVYPLSAYGLTLWVVAAPGVFRKLKKRFLENKQVQRVASEPLVQLYRHDPAFRGGVAIFRGLCINLLYTIFRLGMGIYYLSPWFISMGLYYLGLGILRWNLLKGFTLRQERGLDYEYMCYSRTGRALFLLNLPMGGMIILMIFTDYGYSYPGAVIYLIALHAFYMVISSFIRLGKSRELESPILMAAGVLKCIEAMMSLLGLQTALIAQFSEDSYTFGQTMNAISGGCIYTMVIGAAVYMLHHAKKERSKADRIEEESVSGREEQESEQIL